MSWIKLVDCKDEGLWRGTLFKFPANPPLEKEVILMMYMLWNTIEYIAPSLVRLTGEGASIGAFRHLPKECLTNGQHPMSVSWLIDNWHEFVLPDTDIEKIYIKQRLYLNEVNLSFLDGRNNGLD